MLSFVCSILKKSRLKYKKMINNKDIIITNMFIVQRNFIYWMKIKSMLRMKNGLNQ